MNIQVVPSTGGLTPLPKGLQLSSASGALKREAIAAAQLGRAAAPAAVTPNFVDNGGPLLTNVSLAVIFWGSSWQGTEQPSAQVVINAVASIVSGPYMSKLSQYRNIWMGKVSAGVLYPNDPPNPYGGNDVLGVINTLIENKYVSAPGSSNQLLYFVFIPAGASSSENIPGDHGAFNYTDGSKGHVAWLQNDISDPAFITKAFSYLLVGSCTDPEGNGFQGPPGSCGQQQGCGEIETVCQQPAVVNGVAVWPYWSQTDGACVAPGS